MDWFRWYHGSAADPKWRVIARKSGQPIAVVVAVWAALLERASSAESRGSVEGWSAEDIAAAFDIEAEDVSAVYEAMQGRTLDGDAVGSWDKRQPKREDASAARTREWRDRKKRSATHGDAPVTQGDARGEESRGEEIRAEESSVPDPSPVPENIPPLAVDVARGERREHKRKGVESLIAFVGERHRDAVETCAAMPGTGLTWAQGIMGTWGPIGSMESRRIASEDRAAALGLAIHRFSTEADKFYGPRFKAFVLRAATDVRDERLATEKEAREAEERKRAPTLQQLHEEGLRKLAQSAPPEGTPIDPQTLAKQLASRMTMPGAA